MAIKDKTITTFADRPFICDGSHRYCCNIQCPSCHRWIDTRNKSNQFIFFL